MGKKVALILLLVGLLVCVLISCDDFGVAIDAFEGTWNFPDQGGYSDITVYVDNDGNTGIADIGFTSGDDYYYCYGSGTYSGTVLVGSYDYNSTNNATSTTTFIDSDDSISITYSISGGKLSISCSGTGPLNGKSFSNGVLQ